MIDKEKSLLATIIWFDLFDYPLTLLELGRWRINCDTNDANLYANDANMLIIRQFASLAYIRVLVSLKLVSSKNGLYFLKGREEIIKTRIERAKIAERKFKKAKKAARFLSLIPFVRSIFICNTLGWNNAKDSSDIDFFIIAQKGRIFFVRFFAVLLTELFGWRPSYAKASEGKPIVIRDKICLSFFINNKVQNFESLQHPELKEKWPYDIYLHFWPLQLVLLFKSSCKNFLDSCSDRSFELSLFAKKIKQFFEFLLGNFGERLLEKIQWGKLPDNLKSKIGQGNDVVFSPSILKFHENDRRKFFHDAFIKKYQKFVAS